MGDGTELSYAMYRDLRDHNQCLRGMFCRCRRRYTSRTADAASWSNGELVSGTFFPMLGIRPAVGRLFTLRKTERPAAIRWRCSASTTGGRASPATLDRRHGRSRSTAIRSKSSGSCRRVSGLDIGQPAQVYVPVTMQPQMGPAWLQLEGRRFRWVQVFARLREGVTMSSGPGGPAAALSVAARAGGYRRAFQRRRPTRSGVSRRTADGRRCLARALEPARVGHRAADDPDGRRRRRAADRLRQRRQPAHRARRRAAARAGAAAGGRRQPARRSCACCSSRAWCSPSAGAAGPAAGHWGASVLLGYLRHAREPAGGDRRSRRADPAVHLGARGDYGVARGHRARASAAAASISRPP